MHIRKNALALLSATILLVGIASYVWAKKSSTSTLYTERGISSWYGKKYHGKITASGKKFDMHALTAAHKTLPFNTLVNVRNLENNKVVTVKITDRGPYSGKRIIDLSYEAAKKIGGINKGLVEVEITAQLASQ
tara:strand:+ start:11211 stop:11612 length:402 start_codon:yes stop_codon:yes gene_type:complete